MSIGSFVKPLSRIMRSGPAPVTESPYQKGLNRDFRLPGDPEYVIRLLQQPPNALGRRIAESVTVEGLENREFRKNTQDFIQGSDRQIKLHREFIRTSREHVVSVFGQFKQCGDSRSVRLGVLPSDICKEIYSWYPDDPIAATIRTLYAPSRRNGPAVRLDIWGPQPQSAADKKEVSAERSDAESTSREEPYAKGLRLEKQGRIDEAVEQYKINIAADNTDYQSYGRLAVIYREREQYDREIEVLEQAIRCFSHLGMRASSTGIPLLEKFYKRLIEAVQLRDQAYY